MIDLMGNTCSAQVEANSTRISVSVQSSSGVRIFVGRTLVGSFPCVTDGDCSIDPAVGVKLFGVTRYYKMCLIG